LRDGQPAISQEAGKYEQQEGCRKMQAMVWVGALVSLAGVAGLFYCVMRALRARRAGLPDEGMREELQRVVVINMGALAVSAAGLMLVVLGIFLG
jgi:hypothetical protein